MDANMTINLEVGLQEAGHLMEALLNVPLPLKVSSPLYAKLDGQIKKQIVAAHKAQADADGPTGPDDSAAGLNKAVIDERKPAAFREQDTQRDLYDGPERRRSERLEGAVDAHVTGPEVAEADAAERV